MCRYVCACGLWPLSSGLAGAVIQTPLVSTAQLILCHRARVSFALKARWTSRHYSSPLCLFSPSVRAQSAPPVQIRPSTTTEWRDAPVNAANSSLVQTSTSTAWRRRVIAHSRVAKTDAWRRPWTASKRSSGLLERNKFSIIKPYPPHFIYRVGINGLLSTFG